ncbi:MAG TPA: ABC transporter substrate-binding protein, partial [Tepidisphaeraceae bacterium]
MARLIKLKHLILVLIVALGVWALLPPKESEGHKSVRLGTDPRHLQNLAAGTMVLRVHAGAYLPGLMPDNVGSPLQGLTKVAAAFEKLYPDTRLEFVGVPAKMREWLVTQLSSGQAPDIVCVNVEDVWQDVQKKWYIPLNRFLDAPNPFVAKPNAGSQKWWDIFKYPVPTRGTCAPDGNFYCITLDMIETGIFYNKNIFRNLGLHEPKDWPDFLEIQKKIKAAGYTPTLVDKGAFTDWGVDLAFYQVYSEISDLLDLRYDPTSGDYLKGYLDWDELVFLHSKGFFSPKDARWRETFRILKQWRQYMQKSLGDTEDMMRAFLTQRGAMFWSTSMSVNRFSRDKDIDFDWGIFYLPPIPKYFSRFASGRDQCVIGGSGMQYEVTNSSIKDTDPAVPFEQRMQQSKRLQRVIQFLQFLTTPKNADTVVNEMTQFLPNVKGASFKQELAPFDQFLQRHYSMTKWDFTFDNQFHETFLRMFELYLNNGLTEDEYLDWMQRNLDAACEKLISRKNVNLKPLQQEWDKRRERLRVVKE